jgi:hypothetical protein
LTDRRDVTVPVTVQAQAAVALSNGRTRWSSRPPLEIGDRLEIGGQLGIVRTTEPLLGEREVRLVVQLVRDRI